MSLSSIDPVTNYAKMIAIGICVVILLGLLGAIGYLAYTKSKLETQVANQQTAITALTDANADWADKTAQANAALKSVTDAAAARATAAAAAVQKAQATAVQHTDHAQQIIAAKPAQGVSDCVAAKSLTDSYFWRIEMTRLHNLAVFCIIPLLAACGTTQIVDKPVELDTPVAVTCHIPEVTKPASALDGVTAASTLFVQVQAILAQLQLDMAYEAQLEAANKACQ